MTILDIPIVSRLRRNHGLEHATINILSQRYPRRALGGYSSPSGFWLLGDVPTLEIREAVIQALARLNTGERHLAVHERCGTNYVASGFVAGVLTWLSMAGANTKREKVERLPFAIALATIGFIISQPLGPRIQERITTCGDPGEMTVVEVYPLRIGPLILHHVVTHG